MGHPRLGSGQILVAPIGSPPEAIVSSLNLNVITAKDIAHLFAPRPPDSNKGSFGHVLVIGGALGKTGAAVMAGIAVLLSRQPSLCFRWSPDFIPRS
jgi:NAD(P)H-hydrate epimerase